MKNLMFADTERITHHLMLNAYFNPDLGLFHGQMGTVLAMSEYSKYMNNEVYFDVASCLLDNIAGKMHKNLLFSFASGLSGIGWGIEYLIQGVSRESLFRFLKSGKRFVEGALETGNLCFAIIPEVINPWFHPFPNDVEPLFRHRPGLTSIRGYRGLTPLPVPDGGVAPLS